MTPEAASNCTYATSFVSGVLACMSNYLTLPNLVMIVAIVTPLITFANNFYWKWRERKDRLNETR